MKEISTFDNKKWVIKSQSPKIWILFKISHISLIPFIDSCKWNKLTTCTGAGKVDGGVREWRTIIEQILCGFGDELFKFAHIWYIATVRINWRVRNHLYNCVQWLNRNANLSDMWNNRLRKTETDRTNTTRQNVPVRYGQLFQFGYFKYSRWFMVWDETEIMPSWRC